VANTAHPVGGETIHGDSAKVAVHIDEDVFNSLDSRTVATLLLHEALHTIRTTHHPGVTAPPYPGDYGHISSCISPNS
jgi:hypothetical protein